MGGGHHRAERLADIAMAVYGEKFEDLEEFELREVHELDALLSSARLGPRAYGRLAASRAQASGGTRGP